jgi:hypothetical protein
MELQTIQSKIYEIRGRKVMLDFDLAEMYGIETKRLKEAVRRNIERFPDDFMFTLTKEESINLRSQIASSRWGGYRYQPFAFTGQGVAMLSSVLNSSQAIEINIRIMRAFVAIRQYALGYAELKQQLDEFMLQTNLQFNDIYQALTELAAAQKDTITKPRRRIGFTLGDNTPDNENR